MVIKYHLFYSLSINGPWTETAIVSPAMTTTLTDLIPDTNYFIALLGGIEIDGNWRPLVKTPIGVEERSYGDLNNLDTKIFKVKTLA